MKTKKYKSFNMRINNKESEMIKLLKDKYAINISGAFKNFLKSLSEKMEHNNATTDR